jgi:hypothetical protein
MKKFFIILGIVILALIIGGGIYLYTNKDGLAKMAVEQSFNAIEQVTLSNLTSNYNVAEFKTLVSDAKTKIQGKGFDSPELQSLMLTFQQVYEDQQLDSVEVQTLIEGLNKIAAE